VFIHPKYKDISNTSYQSVNRIESTVNELSESIKLQGEQTRSSLDRISSLFQEGQERIIADRRELSNRMNS